MKIKVKPYEELLATMDTDSAKEYADTVHEVTILERGLFAGNYDAGGAYFLLSEATVIEE